MSIILDLERAATKEANLAKKVRENAKISGKNKAGICLKDLEICIESWYNRKRIHSSLNYRTPEAVHSECEIIAA